MNKTDLEQRTKSFTVDMITFVGALPRNRVTNVLGNQLLGSGTSIGANYRDDNRAASRSDFTHKISIVAKEAAETQYWLELLDALSIGDTAARTNLLQESKELLAVFTTIGKSLKNNR